MSTRTFIAGVSGTELTAAERAMSRAECSGDFGPFRLSFESPAQATVSAGELVAPRPLETDRAGCSIPVDGAAEAAHPVTTSATMIAQVIRHLIGFQGLLMSNDVPMKTLIGSVGGRTRARVAAGTPLHSNDNAQLDALTANTASA